MVSALSSSSADAVICDTEVILCNVHKFAIEPRFIQFPLPHKCRDFKEKKKNLTERAAS